MLFSEQYSFEFKVGKYNIWYEVLNVLNQKSIAQAQHHSLHTSKVVLIKFVLWRVFVCILVVCCALSKLQNLRYYCVLRIVNLKCAETTKSFWHCGRVGRFFRFKVRTRSAVTADYAGLLFAVFRPGIPANR